MRVVRLSHRPGRDDRMTTHVALTARAFGARGVVLPDSASQAARTARDITDRFGGPFTVEQVDDPRVTIREHQGPVVHLTMYGEPIEAVVGPVRSALEDAAGLIVVGGGKVPGAVYERADWNVAVGNQPHSEVAALAVCLDRLQAGRWAARRWTGADQRIVPQASGKRVISDDAPVEYPED
ncbi:MAG: tRNA (cytidine(56)-2'-O)-methyltransferase [Haloferacaceae archaeon]|nr:tRNA (cytidine(56)-2'-O)-methyltransferase [Haloferacaceae archaeon]